MCGRFDNHLAEMHGWTHMLGQWPDVPNSYNIAPSAQIAAFVNSSAGQDSNGQQLAGQQLAGQAMRWGMVPSWSKEFGSKYATFNARVETVADKPTFRNAWKQQQRCLIPMAGYYEWSAAPDGKQPFYITDRNVGGLVAAGLYETWLDPASSSDDAVHWSCTMITRAADPSLARIHARMPILLQPESAQQWLDEASFAAHELQQIESPEIVYWPVDKAVGNVRNNHDRLSQAIDLADDE